LIRTTTTGRLRLGNSTDNTVTTEGSAGASGSIVLYGTGTNYLYINPTTIAEDITVTVKKDGTANRSLFEFNKGCISLTTSSTATDGARDRYVKVKNGYGEISLEVDNNRGIYDYTSGNWLIYYNRTDSKAYIPHWASIGSSDSPVYFNSSGGPVSCGTVLKAVSIASATGSGNAITSLSASGGTITPNKGSTFLTAVSIASATGSGNAITSLSASGGTITPNKGSTFKTQQSAVSSPTASGTDISYIATITQNANGVISATKSTVRSASASQSGVITTGA